MSESDSASKDSGWKHYTVLAAWATGICGIIIAVITNISHIVDAYDHFFRNTPEQITYTLRYTNTSNAQQPIVSITATLPDGVVYTPGSTYYAAPETKNNWTHVEAGDSITGSGVSIKGPDPHATYYLRFKAYIANSSKYICGPNGVLISVTAKTDKGKGLVAESQLQIETEC